MVVVYAVTGSVACLLTVTVAGLVSSTAALVAAPFVASMLVLAVAAITAVPRSMQVNINQMHPGYSVLPSGVVWC